jgi:hypothetical protein
VQVVREEHTVPLLAVTAGMISNTVILASLGEKKIYVVNNEERE